MGRASPFGSYFEGGARLTPVVRNLIVANVVIYLVVLIVNRLAGDTVVFQWLGLSPARFWRGALWQPFTYAFLHLGVFHILFNMLCLWWFGQDIEAQWGSRPFLMYYMVCAAGAGLCVAVVGFGELTPTIGASGAVFGLLLAFAVLFPNRIILFMFLFPMPAKYAVALFGLIELLVLVQSGPNTGGVSQVAHLGGAVVGYVYLRYEHRFRMWIFERGRLRERREAEQRARQDEEWRHFVADELDPILDKISREGIHTLTDAEKRLLRQAKSRSPDQRR